MARSRSKARRKKPPKAVAESVLREFNHLCAICGDSGPQLDHIDGNPANNARLNLLPLCEDQIIWCHVRKRDSVWFNSTVTPPRREWELDVPFREVIEIISEAVWRQIFETHKGRAPESLWKRLFLKDRFSGIDEAAIAGHPDAKETTALVRHPVPEAYVTRRSSG